MDKKNNINIDLHEAVCKHEDCEKLYLFLINNNHMDEMMHFVNSINGDFSEFYLALSDKSKNIKDFKSFRQMRYKTYRDRVFNRKGLCALLTANKNLL